MKTLTHLVDADPVDVEVEDDVECKDCTADDGPWEAVIVVNDMPTCSRCLHELTLVGP